MFKSGVEDLLGFVNALGLLRDWVGEYVSMDSVDLSEGGFGFEVSSEGVGVRRVVGEGCSGVGVFGLDSQSSLVRFENADVFVVTGALVGSGVHFVPGFAGVHWLGLRFRFKVDGGLVKLFEDRVGEFVLVRSRFVDRVFDGSYSDEAIRDEIRNEVETGLVGVFKSLVEEGSVSSGLGNALLLVDGPIFSTPRVISLPNNRPYYDLYWALIKRSVEAVRGVRAVGVVKRVGQSMFYAKYKGLPVDDDTLIKNEVRRQFSNEPGLRVVIGPLEVRVRGVVNGEDLEFVKYCWYVASRLGRDLNVVRVEALDPELAELGAYCVARYVGLDGVPLPIFIADKLSRRLNAGFVRLLASLSPLELTYEGLEVVSKVLSGVV